MPTLLTLAESQLRRWTRDEYYRMAAMGLFDGQHVELIEGQVIEMSPQGTAHASAVTAAAEALEAAFGAGYYARWQMPLDAGELTLPEPDVAIVPGTWRDYVKTHPTSAEIIVEVAEASLAYDRSVKVSLYAKVGVAEYWIINLVDRQLEVYRQPGVNTTAVYGFGYGEKLVFRLGDAVAPLAKPEARIAVADLLP